MHQCLYQNWFHAMACYLNPTEPVYMPQSWFYRLAPSQWETALLCNAISHWLGANQESALSQQWLIAYHLGLYLLSSKTPYRQVSWSLKATRLDVMIIISLWQLTGILAALLPRCLSNFRESHSFETSQNLMVRHPSTYRRGPGSIAIPFSGS